MRTPRLFSRKIALSLCLGCLAGGMAACAPLAITTASVRAADKHQALGDQFYERGRTTAAIREWQVALDLEPGRQSLSQRIQTVGAGQPWVPQADEAAPSLADPDQDPRLARQLQQAEQYYHQSSSKDAEVLWRQILTQYENQAQAQAGLDRLREETYQADPAREYDQMTADLYEQGLRAWRQEAWKNAETKLAEAAKLNPDQPQVKKYLARARVRLAKLTEAAALAELKRKAEAAEQRGDWPAAAGWWQELKQLAPDRPDATQGLARIAPEVERWAKKRTRQGKRLLDQGRAQPALNRFQEVLAVLPGFQPAVSGRARARKALASSRDQKQADRLGRGHFNRGVTLYREGDLTGAIQAWEAAVSAAPQDPEYQEWLNRARRENDEDRAKKQEQAEIRYADGLAAYQRGELDEALAAWKEALELNPGHEKASRNLERIQSEMK